MFNLADVQNLILRWAPYHTTGLYGWFLSVHEIYLGNLLGGMLQSKQSAGAKWLCNGAQIFDDVLRNFVRQSLFNFNTSLTLDFIFEMFLNTSGALQLST